MAFSIEQSRDILSRLHDRSRDRVEFGDDLHRPIRKRLDGILLEQRISNLFNSIEVKLIGKVSTDGIGVWKVFGRFADVIDRGPRKASLSNVYVFSGIYRRLFIKAVDDKLSRCASLIWLSVWFSFTLRPNRYFL